MPLNLKFKQCIVVLEGHALQGHALRFTQYFLKECILSVKQAVHPLNLSGHSLALNALWGLAFNFLCCIAAFPPLNSWPLLPLPSRIASHDIPLQPHYTAVTPAM